MKNIFSLKSITFAAVALLMLAGAAVYADHSWGNYHWGRTSNPFSLKLGDNVSAKWDAYLAAASSDWSASDVLNTNVTVGKTKPSSCKPTSGRVEVCSNKYGFNGWLGLAQIWISGSHITQGAVKVNDSYFNTSTYDTKGWRSLVMCQEIGHTLGLDHQDENFNNDPIVPHTCMDYFRPDLDEMVGPNQHDYDQLAFIYGHLDSINTVDQSADEPEDGGNGGPGNGKGPKKGLEIAEWGKSLKQDGQGRPSLFVNDLGNGGKLLTFVFWTE